MLWFCVSCSSGTNSPFFHFLVVTILQQYINPNVQTSLDFGFQTNMGRITSVQTTSIGTMAGIKRGVNSFAHGMKGKNFGKFLTSSPGYIEIWKIMDALDRVFWFTWKSVHSNLPAICLLFFLLSGFSS